MQCCVCDDIWPLSVAPHWAVKLSIKQALLLCLSVSLTSIQQTLRGHHLPPPLPLPTPGKTLWTIILLQTPSQTLWSSCQKESRILQPESLLRKKYWNWKNCWRTAPTPPTRISKTSVRSFGRNWDIWSFISPLTWELVLSKLLKRENINNTSWNVLLFRSWKCSECKEVNVDKKVTVGYDKVMVKLPNRKVVTLKQTSIKCGKSNKKDHYKVWRRLLI